MKLAILAAAQAFRNQMVANRIERAKTVCEANGYSVAKKTTQPAAKKSK